MWNYNFPLSINHYSKEYTGTAMVNVKTKHCGIMMEINMCKKLI